MTKRKDAEDGLDWAQAKYDEAQERFAWMERPRSDTMDSYSTLISLIESGMAARAKDKADDQKARAAIEPMMEPLMKLAEQMEELGKEGFAYGPSGMVEAARTIKAAFGL